MIMIIKKLFRLFLKLIRNSNILEFETLLINCRYLNELYILIRDKVFDWNKLFEILTKSSPMSLFKFKFYTSFSMVLRLEPFFDNWKGRHPMLLQTIPGNNIDLELIERYKAKGIIEKYGYDGGNF